MAVATASASCMRAIKILRILRTASNSPNVTPVIAPSELIQALIISLEYSSPMMLSEMRVGCTAASIGRIISRRPSG